jgi:hypothetical protein
VDYQAFYSLLQQAEAGMTPEAHASVLALAERYPSDPLFQFHLQRLQAKVFGVVVRMEDQ